MFINDLERRFGAPTITLPRSELITRPGAALAPSATEFGNDLFGLCYEGSKVKSHFGNKHRETVDLVVDADIVVAGLQSAGQGEAADPGTDDRDSQGLSFLLAKLTSTRSRRMLPAKSSPKPITS